MQLGGDGGGEEGGGEGGAGLLSTTLFPPASYVDCPGVVAGLRACGMRSLDEPRTFLAVAEGVAAAGKAQPTSRLAQRSRTARLLVPAEFHLRCARPALRAFSEG